MNDEAENIPQINYPQDAAGEAGRQPVKKNVKKVKTKQRRKGKKSIHIGIGSLMLMAFCSFLIVIATFLQLDVTHLIIPAKFWSGGPCSADDFIYSIKYIPQIPVIMFIVGLLGRRLGITSVILYIITGLFFLPVFALGGGWRYIFEYSFGYILAYIPAAFILGTILKKGYSYKNTAKAVLLAVITIHAAGLLYMMCLAYLKHAGWGFVLSWTSAQSGIKIVYDFVFSYLAVLVAKYARIILWFYL